MERWQTAILNRLAGLPFSGSIADSRWIALASDCLLRVEKVAAIRVGDLADETVGFAHLSVLRSKTDPESHGATLYVDPSAMRRITAWRDDDDVQEQNPSPFPASEIIRGQQAGRTRCRGKGLRTFAARWRSAIQSLDAAARGPEPRDQTFALTLAHTGTRVSEILAPHSADLDLDASAVRIRTLKRRAEHWREIAVPPELALRSLTSPSAASEPLATS